MVSNLNGSFPQAVRQQLCFSEEALKILNISLMHPQVTSAIKNSPIDGAKCRNYLGKQDYIRVSVCVFVLRPVKFYKSSQYILL